MDWEVVSTYIKDLGAKRAKSYKVSLLHKALKNADFVKVAHYALDADRSYGLKKIPKLPAAKKLIFSDVFEVLDHLNEKGSADYKDKRQLVAAVEAEDSPHTADIVNCILAKDLRCGVGAKLINSVIPDTIFKVPYQRCSTESKLKNISYPAIVQKKADGMFAYLFSKNHPRTNEPFLTRNGSGFNLFEFIENDFKRLLKSTGTEEDFVLVGELTVVDEKGNTLDRQTGNGILHKFIEGTGTKEEASHVRYEVWDILHYDEFFECLSPEYESVSYKERYEWLDLVFNQYFACDRIKLIESEIVNSEQEARAFYKKIRSKGFEGAILKDLSEMWSDGTSTKMIKLKNVSEAEFEIVDIYHGEKGKKYEKMLGGVVVQSGDGKIKCSVGSGFTDEDRDYDLWKNRIGGIVTVAFNEVISDKTNRKTKSLSHPRIVEFRTDKSEADTLEYCEELCNG